MNDQPAASDFIQASRVLRVNSPLGADVLLPEKLVVEEAVNDLFTLQLSVRSKRNIKPNELIGKLVDVEIEVAAGEDGEEGLYRPLNGLVVGVSGAEERYRLSPHSEHLRYFLCCCA
jgi:type VI secretion system secreted protein VgrG